MRKLARILPKSLWLQACASLYSVQLVLAAGRGGLLKDISFANVTISGTLFEIFKGGSYFGGREG